MRNSKDNRETINKLLIDSDSQLLREEELNWIGKTDTRLLRWIIYECKKQPSNYQQGIPIPLFYNPAENPESLYYTLIHSVDAWQTPLHVKQETLEAFRKAWSRVLLNSKLKWLDKKNTRLVEWAWTYLNNYIERNEVQTRRFRPVKDEDFYIDIMSTFDNWTADEIKLYELQIGMKNAWAQHKYRKNLKDSNKKQSTYAISTESKKQLEILAKANNVNLNQMLEHVIGEAHKNLKAAKKPKYPEQDSDL